MIKGMAGRWTWSPGQEDHRSDGALRQGRQPKFIPACTLPLTGRNVIDMIITDLAVFERADHAGPFRLVECAPGVTPRK